MELQELFNFTNPESMIRLGGLALLVAVIFAETGLFFGFFLPGDSLLFTAGLLVAIDVFPCHIIVVLLSVTAAAILGDFTSYLIGGKMGKGWYKRKDSFFFKKKYLSITEEYFRKFGILTLVMGRFLPVVRTFAPLFSGMVGMNFKKFTILNIGGGILWVFSLVLTGYILGSQFPNLKDYLEYIIGGLILITIIPVIKLYLRERKKLAGMKPANQT